MMLDDDIKKQLAEYLQLLENDVLIKISTGSDSISNDMAALMGELTALSTRIGETAQNTQFYH